MSSETKKKPDYQVRVIEEKAVMDDKISKLREFMHDDLFDTLDVVDRNLLCDQFDIMEEYVDILEKRIARF